MVRATVTGTGAALPPVTEQQLLWDRYFSDHFAGSRIARRVFSEAGVRRRHTVVDPLVEDPSGWSTGRRMRRYAQEAPALAHRAAEAALADAGLAAEELGLLTVASCTGYSTPGLDIGLAASLGLRPDTQRLLVGHMGCFAALPALGSTADFVAARGRPALLVCVELTSLHVQPPTRDPQQVVSHALFSDAAAALVVQPPAVDLGGLELVDIAALTDSGSSGHMTWDVTDLGFRMGLSPRVPEVLAKHVRPVTEELLARHGLDIPDVRSWAVHPGGPRILDTVEEQLALPPEALAASRAVLAEHGNCSSPTVLLVLREVVRRPGPGEAPAPGTPVVAMAFGPGLTLYAALFRVRPGAG
ncbi:type III polyketide synthase [Streptomyces sp. ACA25]|uniref:type III polyketide synthase n=1 Tax=Streptomyces sp. ACA25 TaxID=3022596 RepID=UPI002306FE24|nr:type III polyketide synthase [Streptomyces sp. ACA25]MDB1086597.1 type III polyketide synthase [Streptomyces sp. ACA25]